MILRGVVNYKFKMIMFASTLSIQGKSTKSEIFTNIGGKLE